MSRVLVIGAAGMLGREVARVLATVPEVDVVPASRKELDAEAGRAAISDLLAQVQPAVIVNCAGVLAHQISDPPSVRRAIAVNALFPHDLARAAAALGGRLVHVSTDAVFSADAGRCFEDDRAFAHDAYGVTKRLGEPALESALSLRCSFVGHGSLVGWLLSQASGAQVNGFVDQAWNGLCAEQVALVCAALVDASVFEAARAEGHVHHLCQDGAPMTKYDLLLRLAGLLRPDVTVVRVKSGRPVSRVLAMSRRVLPELLRSGPSFDASLTELARRTA